MKQLKEWVKKLWDFNSWQPGAIITAVVFVALGSWLVFFSHAAGSSASLESELGTVHGAASTASGPLASGGGYVKFSDPVIVAAGDIAWDCASNCPVAQTAQLALNANPDAVLTLGDSTYHFGEYQEFNGGQQSITCGSTANIKFPYATTWGVPGLLSKTYPAIGNHEYDYDTTYNGCSHIRGKTAVDPAKPYWDFFSSRIPASALGTSGDFSSRKGYYSYDLGSWHIIVLNSECRLGDHGATSRPPAPNDTHVLVPGIDASDHNPCGSTSPEYQWLQADLAANNKPCSLAYWHRPVYISNLPEVLGASTAPTDATVLDSDLNQDLSPYNTTIPSSGLKTMATAAAAGPASAANFWKVLQQYGVDVVLTGHAHVYERIKPVNDQGQIDYTHGITQFIVGTGGAGMQALGTTVGSAVMAHSVTNRDYGVLKATLKNSSFDFTFLPASASGSTLNDSGSVACH